MKTALIESTIEVLLEFCELSGINKSINQDNRNNSDNNETRNNHVRMIIQHDTVLPILLEKW